MRVVKVRLKTNPYQILIGTRLINRAGKFIKKINPGKDAYVISNAPIKNRHASAVTRSLKEAGFSVRFKLVADTEKSKSLKTAASVISDITRYDKKRRIFIIAFGGGVIGDLAGFIASIYKRGIPYIQLPTTLLAQVDSSIGGKTGVDLVQGKNLLGAFYQPRLVISETGFLKTLDTRQVRSGMAEIIKYAIIKDPLLFRYLEKHYRKILRLKAAPLEYVVYRSSSIKAKIVQSDEREERGIRTLLNFGHTIGHAIETAGGYCSYNHGEAVALGMLVEAEISVRLSLLKPAVLARLKKLIKAIGLPVKIGKEISLAKIIQVHYRDKKFIGAKNRLVIIQGIGKAKVVQNIPLKIIRDSLREYLVA